MLQQSVHGIEGVDSVIPIANRGEVRAAVAIYARPEEAIEAIVHGGHVLDRHASRTNNTDAIVKCVLAIEDHLVTIDSANHHIVGLDGDLLVVCAFAHEHEVARHCSIDRFLNGAVVIRDIQHVFGEFDI